MLTLFLVGLFGFIAFSTPISFSLILTTILIMAAMGIVSPQLLTQSVVRGIDSFPLMAVPFFLLAGELMNVGGISNRIVGFARALIGHVSGGLGYVTVVASMIFAGVSGSAVADTSAIGSILYPVMEKEGYEKEKAAALFCSAGTIGPIIPPSIPMILYGVIGNVSVVKLFLGGIVPGVLIGAALMVYWFFVAKKGKYQSNASFSFSVLLRATADAIWALVLPLIIVGGIIFGIYTPTEAAVIAVAYAFFVGFFIYKELKPKHLIGILSNTAKSTSVVMLVCGAATAAAYFITTAQIPQMLSVAILSFAGNSPSLFLLLVNVLLLAVGCVLDITPALLILAPILLPIAIKFGIDPVHFGIVIIINLLLGLLTPPVGNILYVGCSITKLTVMQLAKAILPNIIVMFAVLMLITYVPSIVMFIPNMLAK